MDASSGQWKGTVTAPSTTSWGQTDHKYPGTVTAEDVAGNTTTATTADFPGLALRVLEKVAPTIAVSYPSAGAYITNSKPTIKWTVKDDGSGINKATIAIQIDSAAAITSGITTTAITGGGRQHRDHRGNGQRR